MTFAGWFQIIAVLAAVTLAAWGLGSYMAAVFSGRRTWLTPWLGPVERGMAAASGYDSSVEQGWKAYSLAMLAFNAAGFLLLYGLMRLQGVLPLDPQGFGAVPPDLSFNTAISFVTNTNWQSYAGESTMSHFVQMAGFTVQNFVSAATGIALAVALTRAFARSSASTIGNFWDDLVKATLYVLLPLAIIIGLAFVRLGMPQTLQGQIAVTTLEGVKQTLAVGPIASQEAIKQLGTNGGGFLNANSAHPFENPSAWSNYLSIFAMLVVSGAMPFMFGRMVGDMRQGRALFITMFLFILVGTGIVYWAEAKGVPALQALGIDPAQGNMEGKEVRFGLAMTALFAVATTGLSCGAVNAMHSSLTPLGGLVPLFMIQLGEILPGGTGSGLYGLLVVAILTVFIAGLMVGRTPDYLGKKIESREMKLVMLALLILPLAILGFSAVAAMIPQGLWSLANAGPHGLSEILYAYSSAAGNNGSAFAGLNANTAWYNTTMGIAMFLGRFAYIVPMMAIAGSLAAKTRIPASAGSFPTHGGMFIGLLTGVILILGGLQYFPALALGPIVEHFEMLAGKFF
ncbi:potassium-transporting ATPase subunit KdpA [Aestuariivirga sp.]|uniref:potassium-transporting ATPase subunit KdpA n=1 Tax=Aestuariivirga sp. TaxID=2650926 RepID=UPI0039E2D8DB